jgi:hypothetical protein
MKLSCTDGGRMNWDQSSRDQFNSMDQELYKIHVEGWQSGSSGRALA